MPVLASCRLHVIEEDGNSGLAHCITKRLASFSDNRVWFDSLLIIKIYYLTIMDAVFAMFAPPIVCVDSMKNNRVKELAILQSKQGVSRATRMSIVLQSIKSCHGAAYLP